MQNPEIKKLSYNFLKLIFGQVLVKKYNPFKTSKNVKFQKIKLIGLFVLAENPINKPFMLVDKNSKVGSVTSCAFSPDFNTNIAIGMVNTKYLKNNEKAEALIGDQKRLTKIMDKPLNRKLRAFSD